MSQPEPPAPIPAPAAHTARPAIRHEFGPMAADSPWYVERKADRAALRHFQNHGVTVALRGCPGSGKSSLANHLRAVLEQEGWTVALVDVKDGFDAADFDNGQGFLRRLAENVCREIGGPESALAPFARDGTPSAFKTFIHTLFPPDGGARLLLTLDRMEALAGKPCCSSVLSGLRLLYSAQNQLGAAQRAKMLLLHTVKPLQTGRDGSVFDGAFLIDVADFSLAELAALAGRHGLPADTASPLHAMLGGHPLLSRVALNAMVEDGLGPEQIFSAAALADGGIFASHLERVERNFAALPDGGLAAANAFRAMLKHGALHDAKQFDALLGLGVVRGGYFGDAAVRCGLYASFLPPRLPF